MIQGDLRLLILILITPKERTLKLRRKQRNEIVKICAN